MMVKLDATAIEDENGVVGQSPETPADAGPDAWPEEAAEEIRVHLLATCERDGKTFGVGGTVVPAYLDVDGDAFLAFWHETDAEDYELYWLEAEQFELVEAQAESAEPAPDGVEAPEAPPAAADAPTPTPDAEPTADAQAAFDARKHQLEEHIGQLAIEQVHLKAAVKANREALGQWTDDLRDHLMRGPVRLPLFDRKPEATEQAAGKAEGDGEQPGLKPGEIALVGVRYEPHPDDADDLWRDLDIGEALPDLTEKILEVLQGHDLNTMGDLADVVEVKGKTLDQLKGVTEKRLEKIEAALEKFWTARKAEKDGAPA